MQQCAQANYNAALHCGSKLDDAAPTDLHPGCVYLAVMHSGRATPSLVGIAQLCNYLGHKQTMHNALSPWSLNRRKHAQPRRQFIAAPAAVHHPIN